MGHMRMGELPATRKWDEVIQLISGGADVETVAAATSMAAERSMIDASNDPAVCQAFWLLTQIPLAARQPNFPGRLRELGLAVGNRPSLTEICCALTEAIDIRVPYGARTDFGEMAQLSAVEALNAVTTRETGNLFDARHEETREALAGLATVKQFGVLGRDFFARLTRRYLEYYLSRELPRHVGPERRFHSLSDHQHFQEALETHCRETALIVRDFAGEWFSKTNYETGIAPEHAGRFANIAFSKIRKELRQRRVAHA